MTDFRLTSFSKGQYFSLLETKLIYASFRESDEVLQPLNIQLPLGTTTTNSPVFGKLRLTSRKLKVGTTSLDNETLV